MAKPDPEEVVMPVGDYRGKKIANLPSGYLRWLARDFRDPVIRDAAQEELDRRDGGEGRHFND